MSRVPPFDSASQEFAMIQAAAVGILDFGVAHHGEGPLEIVEHTIHAARRADALGFGRYWLAEHQTGECRWATPEMVLALIARETTRIRVGAGGLLMIAHNPLRVANDYSLLAQLHPNRIDIGLARGTPGENVLALVEPVRNVDGSPDGFSSQLVALFSYLHRIPRPQHAYFRARTFPAPHHVPELWILGTGGTSGEFAAQFGLPFALSIFHFPDTPLTAIAKYRRDFWPSAWSSEPRTMVAIAGICAETRERAREIAASQPNKVTLNVVGTAHDWRERVEEIVSATGADEIMYLDASPLPEQRLCAYELIGDALNAPAVARTTVTEWPLDHAHSVSGSS
jgi:luciferase family oxidoreductase group 1